MVVGTYLVRIVPAWKVRALCPATIAWHSLACTDPLRAIPAQVERKLHLLARRLVLPHPKGGMIDVVAPLPLHMQKTFELFGFDAKQRDPIEDAPEE